MIHDRYMIYDDSIDNGFQKKTVGLLRLVTTSYENTWNLKFIQYCWLIRTPPYNHLLQPLYNWIVVQPHLKPCTKVRSLLNS